MLGLIVMGVIIAALVVTMGALHAARKEANYQESLVDAFKHLSDNHWDSYRGAAGRVDELEVSLHDASSELSIAETVITFLTEKVVDLVDEVGGLEEDLEEVEEELDDMKESVGDALAGWARSDALSETTLAWGTRVVNLLDRAERERRL